MKLHLIQEEKLIYQVTSNPILLLFNIIIVKILGKDNLLDYTFLSLRNSLFNQSKKTKVKDYLFDLHQTLDLNMDFLENTLKTVQNKAEQDELLKIFNQFHQKLQAKNQKRKLLNKKESQLLIEKQIIQQLKRKLDDTNTYYREQLKDGEENFDSKEEYIKIFEKKLQEVEIYIQKNTKTLTKSHYVKYKGWKMNDFLEISNYLARRKDLIMKDINKIRNNMSEIKQENTVYREELETEESINKNTNDISDSDKKLKVYMEYYRKQIRVIQMRMKLLKTTFDSMTDTMKYLKFDKEKMTKTLKEKEDLNKTANFGNGNDQEENDANANNNMNNCNHNKDGGNKSILPLDITRKINNMMDFSILLNKKGDETKYDDLGKTGMGGLGNVTNLNMWDISCINKN